MKRVLLITAMLSTGCADQMLLQPSKIDVTPVETIISVEAIPTPTPVVEVSTTGNVVAFGCVVARDLPSVLSWRITGLQSSTKVDKSYEGDEESTCDATNNTNHRTQNDHLRFRWVGEDLVIDFDRDTFDCGRAQVDVDTDGAPRVRLVIQYGRTCVVTPPPTPPVPPVVVPPPAPPKPPTPPVPPTPPTPLAPPVCDVQAQAYQAAWTATGLNAPIAASANVSGAGNWTITLYAGQSYGHADYTKATKSVELACGKSGTISVSYPWTGHPSKAWWFTAIRNNTQVYASAAVTH